jgi:hypothetical protein
MRRVESKLNRGAKREDRMFRYAIAAAALSALLWSRAQAEMNGAARIGVLNDMSSVYSDFQGRTADYAFGDDLQKQASEEINAEGGQGLVAKGLELAHRIAGNAPFANFAVMHLLPRIARSDPAAGYVTEALAAAIAQGDEEAKARLKAFLEKRAPKVART